MKHIDLFSGIGGFALAADRVFGDIEHTFVTGLADRISMLPTPRVSETEGAPVKNAELRNGSWSRKNAKGVRFGVKVKDVVETLNGKETGAKLRLQPAMTEWMMGFPEGWATLQLAEQGGEEKH